MGLRGTLAKQRYGFSMPVHAPAFPGLPYEYHDATLMVFKYVTDGATSAGVVPDALELPDPPTAGLVFARYPRSTLGPYDEVVLYHDVLYDKKPYQYAVHLYVTTDVAMAAGREVGGYPKQIARVEYLEGPNPAAVLERPAGLRLCSGTMRPEQKAPAQFPIPLEYLTLRLIPSPQAGAPPTVEELLPTRWTVVEGEVWTGPGSCQLTGASALDPLHLVPVVRPIVCEWIRGTIRVDFNPPGASGAP
jgi:acetoacetate decarboxylase